MDFHISIQVLSILFALGAAISWMGAALTKTPPELTQIIITDVGFDGELAELFTALSKQANWNKYGASFASVAALLQGLSFLFSLHFI